MRDVTEVKCLGGHRLELRFDNDERREIDIGEFVSFDGVFELLRDPTYFRRVAVNADLGTIVWPNGADLCPDVLYAKSTPVKGNGSRSGS
ncbi:MAG: DUF2442 domain-containing protein [Phycisphaerae bacterium]|nr:DUF2442 domain-containing protein [Phycisphaerae bacterium]